MREIKFRYIYQHEEDSDFPEFSLQIADTRDSTWTLEQISEGEPNNYISVCLSSSWKVIAINQYTGLKDKNGKEIYEGDILAIKYSSHETLIKVIFKDCCFVGLKTKNNFSDDAPLNRYDLKNSEIIGNIYENQFLNDKFENLSTPELLNK